MYFCQGDSFVSQHERLNPLANELPCSWKNVVHQLTLWPIIFDGWKERDAMLKSNVFDFPSCHQQISWLLVICFVNRTKSQSSLVLGQAMRFSRIFNWFAVGNWSLVELALDKFHVGCFCYQQDGLKEKVDRHEKSVRYILQALPKSLQNDTRWEQWFGCNHKGTLIWRQWVNSTTSNGRCPQDSCIDFDAQHDCWDLSRIWQERKCWVLQYPGGHQNQEWTYVRHIWWRW